MNCSTDCLVMVRPGVGWIVWSFFRSLALSSASLMIFATPFSSKGKFSIVFESTERMSGALGGPRSATCAMTFALMPLETQRAAVSVLQTSDDSVLLRTLKLAPVGAFLAIRRNSRMYEFGLVGI